MTKRTRVKRKLGVVNLGEKAQAIIGWPQIKRSTMIRILHRSMLILIVLGAALVVTAVSRAQTNAQAQATAIGIQKTDCVWGSPVFYSCSNPYFIFPVCQLTGIDQVGKPQHICGGVFTRRNRILGSYQFCTTTYFLSPWGREVYPSGYSCSKNLGATRDRR